VCRQRTSAALIPPSRLYAVALPIPFRLNAKGKVRHLNADQVAVVGSAILFYVALKRQAKLLMQQLCKLTLKAGSLVAAINHRALPSCAAFVLQCHCRPEPQCVDPEPAQAVHRPSWTLICAMICQERNAACQLFRF